MQLWLLQASAVDARTVTINGRQAAADEDGNVPDLNELAPFEAVPPGPAGTCCVVVPAGAAAFVLAGAHRDDVGEPAAQEEAAPRTSGKSRPSRSPARRRR